MSASREYLPLGQVTTVDESDNRYIARINEELELKDGSRIRANVFLPRTGGPKWPVLMSSSPYGKDVPLLESMGMEWAAAGIPEDHRCKHLTFEAPSPAWWCPKGYVLVYHDHRGAGQSPGHLSAFSQQHYDDYAEIVTWAADQTWSTGRVGLTGISYFGLNQWFVAARRPRGLSCVMPWEGFSDLYRDSCRHGGIGPAKMSNFWFHRAVLPVQYGKGGRHLTGRGPDSLEGNLSEQELLSNRDDFPTQAATNEFIEDEFYRDSNTTDLSKIEVPLLSAGNWGGITLHLRGNVIGWMRAGSMHKYLRLHTGRHDLPYYYSPGLEMQKSFFDCWLKDDDHGGWKAGKQAPVSFAVRKGNPGTQGRACEPTFTYRDENEWPLARTVYQKVVLTSDRKLSHTPYLTEATLSYTAFNGNGILFETEPAEEEYEICGHPSVRLSMSLNNHPESVTAEIEVFMALRKIDVTGAEALYTSSAGEPQPVTLGWLRASHRCPSRKPYPEFEGELAWPTLSHRKADKKQVKPGEIYDLAAELWPTNVVVAKGEKIVLEVSPKDIDRVGLYMTEHRSEEALAGSNEIHFAPQYQNYLVLPIV